MYGTEHTFWYRYYGANRARYSQTLTECTAQNTQFDIDITVRIERVTVKHLRNVRHRTQSWYRYYGANRARYSQTLTECTAQNTQFDIDITMGIERVTVKHLRNVRHRTHCVILQPVWSTLILTRGNLESAVWNRYYGVQWAGYCQTDWNIGTECRDWYCAS